MKAGKGVCKCSGEATDITFAHSYTGILCLNEVNTIFMPPVALWHLELRFGPNIDLTWLSHYRKVS